MGKEVRDEGEGKGKGDGKGEADERPTCTFCARDNFPLLRSKKCCKSPFSI
jgi:hypothetical protein